MKLQTFFVLALMGFGTAVMAQGVRVEAGVNLANISTTNNGQVNDANQLVSFRAGLIGVLPLGTKIITVQPGLIYTGKGSKTVIGTEGGSTYSKNTFNPRYLELPVNVVLTFPLGKDNGIFVGAGPYVAMGLGGKNKVEGQLAGVPFNSEEKIKWSKDDPTTSGEEGAGFGVLRRFDYGLNGTAGVEVQKVTLCLGYGYGLAKLQSGSNSSNDDKYKNRVWSLSLGYKIGK